LSQLKQKLDQGVIGEIQYINSNIGFAFQGRRESRLFKPELAGGSLLDLGVYSIALSQFLLDEDPEKIQALGQIGNTQVDTNIIVNMLYPSGRLSQFTCTMLGQASNTMTIVGSKGHVILPAYFWDVNEAQIFNDEILTDSISIPHLVNGFEYQIEESMRCIAAGKNFSDLMSHQASVGIMQVMDEVRSQIGLVYDHAIERL
jgi:predicted dehydrogenase